MYCRESPSCKAGRDIIVAQAGNLGLQVVHEAQVSLTQPDFTAEMLAAKSAGAEAIIPFVDNNTVIRMSRSSKRQGYTPVYSAQYASHDERFLKNGGADIAIANADRAMYQAKPAATDACVIAHNTSRRRRTATWPPSIVLLSSEILVTLLTPAQAVLLANRLAASAVGSGPNSPSL